MFGKSNEKGGFQKEVGNDVFFSEKGQICQNSSRTQYETAFVVRLGFNIIHLTEFLHSFIVTELLNVSCLYELFWGLPEENDRELGYEVAEQSTEKTVWKSNLLDRVTS